MKLNKKGISLMELLISIILISVVLLFIFQLLVDVENETDSNNYSYNNQINRIEALYAIANDINNINNELVAIINNNPVSSNTILDLDFNYKNHDVNPKLTITKEENGDYDRYYLNYLDYNGNQNRYEMKDVIIDPCISYISKRHTNGKYYFRLNVNVYNYPDHERNNKNYNNLVDDLEIEALGYVNDLNPTNNLLYKDSGYINCST